MRELNKILDNYRLTIISETADGLAAQCHCIGLNKPLYVIASWGGGWEHVSVSLPSRCPTWDEMCVVKGIFWEPSEVVMQLHPDESQYVNNHPNCLHMWRPMEQDIPMPPSFMVGLRKGQTVGDMEREAAAYFAARNEQIPGAGV